MFPFSILSDRYLRAKENCFIRKGGGVQSTSAYFLKAAWKAEEKISAAQRTFTFGNARSSCAFSGEKLMISMGLRSNKCMHTEGLGKAGPAQRGLGLDVEWSSAQPTNTPRDSTSLPDLPRSCTGSLFSLLSTTFQGILLHPPKCPKQ